MTSFGDHPSSVTDGSSNRSGGTSPNTSVSSSHPRSSSASSPVDVHSRLLSVRPAESSPGRNSKARSEMRISSPRWAPAFVSCRSTPSLISRRCRRVSCRSSSMSVSRTHRSTLRPRDPPATVLARHGEPRPAGAEHDVRGARRLLGGRLTRHRLELRRRGDRAPRPSRPRPAATRIASAAACGSVARGPPWSRRRANAAPRARHRRRGAPRERCPGRRRGPRRTRSTTRTRARHRVT